MSFSYYCLISKITLTPLLNWHNGLFCTRPEYDPILWPQKGQKLPPLSLTALEGRECDSWFSSRQKDAVRHWSGKRVSPRSLDSQRHAWESLCLMLVLWLTYVISQVMTFAFLSSLILGAWSVLLAVMWHEGTAHLFFREFIALSYEGLNSPYRNLKENNLLFSPYSSLGGALNGPFYITFFIWDKNAYYINAVCIDL